ncbi:MAG TPA: hypothetical protein VMX55_10490 [candidate division Zixibacteria bacterium]|nr:hypothetical protein [candidate division Zixibacteria bacterium]
MGRYDEGGSVLFTHISDEVAFLATSDGLEIIDVSNKTNPQLISEYPLADTTRSVFVQGDFAYLARNTVGVEVVNISDLSNPEKADYFCDDSAYNIDVFVAGDYAYVAEGDKGLEILDKTDPENLVQEGQYDDSTGTSLSVHVVGNYAFVADYDDGLEIIDVSNPSSPNRIGHFNDGMKAEDVVIVGDYAFVADSNTGLKIINITDLTSPNKVDQYDCTVAESVFVYNNFALVGRDFFEVDILDVSDPEKVTYIDHKSVSGSVNEITVLNGYAYFSAASSGLVIAKVGYDADGDDLTYYEETSVYFTDPNDNDSDNDLLNDWDEIFTYNTDPNDSDSDNDDVSDYEEIIAGTDPLDPEDFPITTTPPSTTTSPTEEASINQSILGLSILFLFGVSFAAFIKKKK